MTLKRKKPQEKRYRDTWNDLYPLFRFIFINLERSNIQFDLYKEKWGKKIKKEYDVCLLISLYILKLIARLSTPNSLSKWENAGECGDTDLLLIWYFAFNEQFADERFIKSVGKDRWEEIKIPDICDWFYDETKVDKIKNNNFNKYMRSIPPTKIQKCIAYLWYIVQRAEKSKLVPYAYVRYKEFSKNFINGMDLKLPPKHKMLSEKNDNFSYYFKEYGRSYDMLWSYLISQYPEEVTKRMDEVQKKKTKKQNWWEKLESRL